MKVVLYARVSTDDTDQSPERQLFKCRQYAQLHDHEVVGEFYEHVTGDSDPYERPECSKALRSGAEGVIVFSMDRLSRQHPVKVIRLVQRLRDDGITLISTSEPMFNMENELGEVMLYLMAWFNNYFLRKNRENIVSGIEARRSKGLPIGRPKAKFNRYRAAELLRRGRTLGEVAGELGVSKATVHRFKNSLPKDGAEYLNEEPVSKRGLKETED